MKEWASACFSVDKNCHFSVGLLIYTSFFVCVGVRRPHGSMRVKKVSQTD